MKEFQVILKAKYENVKEWVKVNRRSLVALVVGFALGAIIY